MSVTVIVPAHDEAGEIEQTISALQSQSRSPDTIVVVADNCSDDTAALAARHGADVITTVGNTGRKAGAINQALSILMPDLSDDDAVMIMDADTSLSPTWIAAALKALADPRVGGVSGTYLGEPGTGLLRQCQRNEFVRASRLQYRRRPGSVWCLSGTGTMARAAVLRQIAQQRGALLPGQPGDVYNPSSVTEDFELTMALKHLGYRCVIPMACDSITEVMPSVRTWFNQRLRWQLGTLESLREYGLTRVTWGWGGWTRQGLFHLRFVAQFALWAVLIISLMHSGISFPPLTTAALTVIFLERIISVRKAGPKGIVLAALIVPEFLYGICEGSYLVTAAVKLIRGSGLAAWGHL